MPYPTGVCSRAAAPNTPVFVLHRYDRAWLNGTALRAVGYTKETPIHPGASSSPRSTSSPRGAPASRTLKGSSMKHVSSVFAACLILALGSVARATPSTPKQHVFETKPLGMKVAIKMIG